MEYRRFGVMLDCSRNAVMRPEEVKHFIDIIKKMGYNCIKLYTEDTYEVEEEPYMGYLRGRYTAAQIRDMDAYALSQGVELIPCIQTLGHLDAPKKNYTMEHLFDIDDILLCEDEATYTFIDHCFASVAKNFTSKTVNIGMDEAYLAGFGKYFRKHGFVPKFDLLIAHLTRVCELAKKHGLEPVMWSDMFFHPVNPSYIGKDIHLPKEVCAQIPDNISLAYWDYTTKDVEIYDSMIASHRETGRPMWFVGGAWTWVGPAPFNQYTLWSMKPAMESVLKNKVEDVIITMWGNGGKECSFYSILPALYAIRQYADGNFDEEKIHAGFEEMFGIPYDDFCALDLPNDTGDLTYFNHTGWPEDTGKCLLYQDPFLGYFDVDWANRPYRPPFEAHADRLMEISKRAGEFSYLFVHMANYCRALALKSDLGMRTRAAYDAKDRDALRAMIPVYEETILRVRAFYESFYDLWHKENHPAGFETHDYFMGGLLGRLASCKCKIEDYLAGKIEAILELEERLITNGKKDMVEYGVGNISTRSIFR